MYIYVLKKSFNESKLDKTNTKNKFVPRKIPNTKVNKGKVKNQCSQDTRILSRREEK